MKLSKLRVYINSSVAVSFFIYVTISLFSNFWLFKGILTGKQVYVHGTLPIHQPYPFKPLSAWNSLLSIRGICTPPSNLISFIYFLGPNLAWVSYEFVFPIIGGFFMYLLIRKEILIYEGNKNSFMIAPTIAGALFELVLLSKYTDFWIKGFLAITPVMLFCFLVFLEAVKRGEWIKSVASALLTVLFLASLYDWRLLISGFFLMIVFLIGLLPFSLITRIFRERKFWIITSVSLLVWCVLWLIPHLYNVNLYSLSFTRSVTLPVIVGDYRLPSVYGLYSGDRALRILYLFVVCIAFLSLLMHKKSPIYKFVLTSSIVVIFLTLIIWDQSPLKSVQYFLTSLSLGRFDVGVLFRTPRVFVGIVLPLTTVLFGISVYYIYLKISNKKKKIACLLLIILLIGSIGGKIIVINNSENKVTIIPDEYYKVANWLNKNLGAYRVLWLPRTGKYMGERPLWFKTEGWGIPETSLGVRTYYYYGKPMEYLYPFLMDLLENNMTRSVAYILSYLGVKYVALHNDYWWDVLNNRVNVIRENLNTSPYFKLRISTKHIFIYENLLANKPVHISSVPIIIDGGLKTLASLIESSNIDFSNYSFFFSDLPIPKDVIYSAPLIVTDSIDDLRFNLLINLLISEGKEKYILVPSFFTEGIKRGEWHPFFIDNPHHAEWEVFYTWNLPNARFEHSFKFYWGFIGSKSTSDSIKIPIEFNEKTNYILLVRYLENSKGGKIGLSIGNKTIYINTKGRENAFRWFAINITLPKESHTLFIKNFGGLNAINIIAIMPEEEFISLYNKVNDILSYKNIISFNLLKNPSFEEISGGLPKYWRLGNANFTISFDVGYSGMHSLKVSTNMRKEKSWSWIVSEPISVVPGRKYLIITHMKAYNVRGSHIAIIGYYPNGYHPEIAQVPSGVSGTFDWREYSYILEIPRNITKIRIALNAGWVLDPSKGPAITWFDDIKVIPINNTLKLENIKLSNHYRTFKITKMEYKNKKYIIDIKTYDQNTSFSITIPEQYHGGWEAIVDEKTIVKSSPQLFVNNFWIKLNRPGNHHIEITFYPQTTWHIIYLVNLATILAITIIGCYIYVINLKTKNSK